MVPHRALGPLLLSAACLTACSQRNAEPDTLAVARPVQEPPAVCPLVSGQPRVTAESIAGLPLRLTPAALRRMCPASRVDTVGVGGTSVMALTVTLPGAKISALQTRHEDSLRSNEPFDQWVILGDSLRFADGTLIPDRVGPVREMDSVGVVVIDRGDDGPGSYIVRCRYPYVAMVVNNNWPDFADDGTVSLSRVATTDPTPLWRVEAFPNGASGAESCRLLSDRGHR